MVSASRKEILIAYMEMARKNVTGLTSGFNQGFDSAIGLTWCWISFEAFTCGKYQQDGVWSRIDSFVEDFSEYYRENYKSFPDELRRNVVGLKGYSVTDERPSHREDDPKKIEDVKDLMQVMKLIYQVRNNLLHGGKDMEDEKDMTLVKCSATVLYYLLEKILSKEGLLNN